MRRVKFSVTGIFTLRYVKNGKDANRLGTLEEKSIEQSGPPQQDPQTDS